MFVNNEDSLAEKGDPPALSLVAFDKAGDGVAEVGRGLEATVREQGNLILSGQIVVVCIIL